jgi:hypothetical protein
MELRMSGLNDGTISSNEKILKSKKDNTAKSDDIFDLK